MRYNARKPHPAGPKKGAALMTFIRQLNPRLALRRQYRPFDDRRPVW